MENVAIHVQKEVNHERRYDSIQHIKPNKNHVVAVSYSVWCEQTRIIYDVLLEIIHLPFLCICDKVNDWEVRMQSYPPCSFFSRLTPSDYHLLHFL